MEAGDGHAAGHGQAVIYCVVARDLAARLLEPLRRHFAEGPVHVVVEQRSRERRRRSRRSQLAASTSRGPSEPERRLIRNLDGRRLGDRRAAVLPSTVPQLPRRARPFAERLSFVERVEPSGQLLEDLDSGRLVTRIQAGEGDLFALLYVRYFDRVYSYLRMLLDDPHEAEDATQQVFLKVLEALPRYERRTAPFRGWLFVIVRHHALAVLGRERRMEVTEEGELNRRLERGGEYDSSSLSWISDGELLMFIERLPVAQRQVLLLRYMLDLSAGQTAEVLGRSAADVRMLQSRALRFLQVRLTAIGGWPKPGPRIRMGRVRREVTVLRARRWALMR